MTLMTRILSSYKGKYDLRNQRYRRMKDECFQIFRTESSTTRLHSVQNDKRCNQTLHATSLRHPIKNNYQLSTKNL